MPTKRYEIWVNGKKQFIKYTQTEINRLSNLLNDKNIEHQVKTINLL